MNKSFLQTINENVTQALKMENVGLTLSAASGPVEILKGVDFVAGQGECIAIVGPSGSGKSSLIAVAAGLEQPTSGEVILLGERLTGRSEDDLARLRRGRISMIFQSFHLLPTMTAFDNVRAPLEIARLDNVNVRATETLKAVGLADRLNHYPGQLSGGEQQRVAVARALACDPVLVFADEPTGNLDTATGNEISDMLFSIVRDRGATLVLVTHDREIAERASRTVIMQDGRII